MRKVPSTNVTLLCIERIPAYLASAAASQAVGYISNSDQFAGGIDCEDLVLGSHDRRL